MSSVMSLRRFLVRVAWILVAVVILQWSGAAASRADVTLVENGQARAVVFVPARVWDDPPQSPEPATVWKTLKAEDNRRRLRESVRDFVGIVQRMSGAKLEVVVGAPPANDTRPAILIGELAPAPYAGDAKIYPYQQGFRVQVAGSKVSVAGQSDLAVSYAIYTLLDQLGCRWFMPSPLGEVLPKQPTITVTAQDLTTGPATIYRGLWYCDNDYARRNRLGGMELSAGHALEFTVPKELRESHPEIRAMIGGKPHPHLIKWTHPLVADAISSAALAQFEKNPDLHTFSLSPDDGATWDESDDRKYDAGDFDPSIQTVSKTDRLLVLVNRVAERVSAKYPQAQFGVLAYVDYTRPPVREKLHPNVVPQIAPITFSRAHPMNDDGEPNNASLRRMIEGWAKASPAVSYYFYAYYLAEVSSPNPMMTKWGNDIPYVYRQGHCRYWQPETMTNFETSMHALYLGLRMAWDPAQEPAKIFDELHTRFYGAAAHDMAAYWTTIDRGWIETPEYAGCGFGHLRRWTPEKLAAAKQHLTAAAAACQSDTERQRVELATLSFDQFAQFMRMRRDLADGKWTNLATDAADYRQKMIALGERFQPQFAFTRMGWTGPETVNVRYFDAFYRATYDDAARVARDFRILNSAPLRQWRFKSDPKNEGEAAGWLRPEFDDAAWAATDCVVDTWSRMGLHNYMGSAWYRATIDVPDVAAEKKVRLWVGATDGRVRVFVNGQRVPYIDAMGKSSDSFSGYCQPVSFDITATVKRGGKNSVALWCTREFMNELGTGGLLAPLAIYTEK